MTHEDHNRIEHILKDLNNQQLLSLATELGLCYNNYRRKEEHLLGDIVAGWLNKDDNITKTPCWQVLRQALKKCGHKGLSEKIKKSEYYQ